MSSIFIENYKRINVFISFYGFVGLNIGNKRGSFDQCGMEIIVLLR